MAETAVKNWTSFNPVKLIGGPGTLAKAKLFIDGRQYLYRDYTQPVGLGSPATLQAPAAGPLGNIS